jgi:hypothetical protein
MCVGKKKGGYLKTFFFFLSPPSFFYFLNLHTYHLIAPHQPTQRRIKESMPRLIPTESTTISVHPGTLGYETQKLAVDKHCFKAPQQPSKQKLALVFSHSNGFNKETLHPLIRQVVKGMHQQDRYQQTDLCVFAWDARNHGDSARLNEGTLLESCKPFGNRSIVLYHSSPSLQIPGLITL